MKIRSGFVSNSSSSSFIISNHYPILSEKDVPLLDEIHSYRIRDYSSEKEKYKIITREDVQKCIKKELIPISFEDAVRIDLNDGYLDLIEDKKNTLDEEYAFLKKMNPHFGIKTIEEKEKTIKRHKDLFHYYFITIGDDDPFGSLVEHFVCPQIADFTYNHH